jgi:hypothetical protein
MVDFEATANPEESVATIGGCKEGGLESTPSDRCLWYYWSRSRENLVVGYIDRSKGYIPAFLNPA